MRFGRLMLVILALFTAFSGCGRGVEAGNPSTPSIINKLVTVVPTGGNVNYVARFVTDDSVVVSRVEKGLSPAISPLRTATTVRVAALVDTVSVSYNQNGNTVTFTATFIDGTEITVTLTLDGNGNVTAGSVTVDGQAVTANISSSGGPNTGNATSAVNAGIAALRLRDVEAAQDAFCDEFNNQPGHATLAFGCFWSKMMLLPEAGESAALLAAFDESPFDLDASILGNNGLFANQHLLEIGSGKKTPFFNYTDFNLPFAVFMDTNAALNTTETMASLLSIAIANNITASDIQDMLSDLNGHFRELELLLAVSLADQSFSFTLPRELFRRPTDVTVTYTDTMLFMGSTQMSIVSIDFANAYDSGVDIDRIVLNGDIDRAILVADLNGAGTTVNGRTVDTISFATLTNGNLITNSRGRFHSGLQLLRAGLNNINNGQSSQFVSRIQQDYDLPRGVEQLDDLVAAMSADTQVTYGTHTFTLNMDAFFDNPPDASTLSVTAGDPFVLQNGEVTFVENYFRQLLQGIATF